MARRSEGLKLFRRESGLYCARFTHAGRRYHVATGETTSAQPRSRPRSIYDDVVSGRWAPGGRQAAPAAGTPFDEVAARWLAHIEPSIDEKTFRLYRDTYVGSHFASFFKTIEQLTTVGRAGLHRGATAQGHARRRSSTSCRRSAAWPSGRTPAGTCSRCRRSRRPAAACSARRSRTRASGVSLIFTVEEIAAIVARLPSYWSAPRAQQPYPVRARFIVAWETALRPRTLAKLDAPGDYHQGATTLHIRDEIDKNRFGRELPLSEAARAALDSVCPDHGLIFGHHDCTMLLRRAAKAAGIDAYRADRISDYDFRHSAATHLGRSSDNLPGRDVPARPQAAGDHGALHATAAGRRARSAAAPRPATPPRSYPQILAQLWSTDSKHPTLRPTPSRPTKS